MNKEEPKKQEDFDKTHVEHTAKEVGSLMFNSNISDEEFKRTATDILAKMFASI
jgi:hypothetical protein